MAPVAEAQYAVHYCGQVVFDRTCLNRLKKLASAVARADAWQTPDASV